MDGTMKALALIDDRWHPGAVVRSGLDGLGEFEWMEDGRAWNKRTLAGRGLVVLAKSNHVSSRDFSPWADEQTGGELAAWTRAGGGLLAIHSGISGYDSIPGMRSLPAGAFLHHPEPCPVTLVPRADHPLTRDVPEFTAFDEHYFVATDDPAADVFLHARSPHGLQPAGWRRQVGRGRVCVLTPGHTTAMWATDGFRRLLAHALLWCQPGSESPRA